MAVTDEKSLDVAIIGGGPAGISACLQLSKSPPLRIALFESSPELGGMPKTCHIGFGMRDRKRLYTGPAYARKLERLVRKTSVQIYTDATVIGVMPGSGDERHQFQVATKEGLQSFRSRSLLLSTGCFENSRPARDIPGERPAGVYTTGTLQQIVNLHHLKPGRSALIIGSEHVALSCVLTLRRSGTSIIGMVEEDPELHTYPSLARVMSSVYRFPIFKNTVVEDILGRKRVEGVKLKDKESGREFQVTCDTVVMTGKFRPISTLLDSTGIALDPATGGPMVDANLMTSIPYIYAAGNILRGADMNDLCALEGKRAAQNLLRDLQSLHPPRAEYVPVSAEPPIRYVVPQKIIPSRQSKTSLGWFSSGFSLQLKQTLKHPTLEAWSGDEKVWEAKFSRLLANNRISLPVGKFDWNRVDLHKGIVLKIRRDQS